MLIGFQRNWFQRLAYVKLTAAFLWASLTKNFPKMPEFPTKTDKPDTKEPTDNVLPIQKSEIQGTPISVV